MPERLTQSRNLPHSEESERAVLAAILLDGQRHLPSTSGRLRPEDFYIERHQKLYEAMLWLQEEGSDIDLRTLQARLEQQGVFDQVGGLAYVATLEVDLPDLGRVDQYIEIVKERSLRRRLIDACSQIFVNSQDGGLEAREALDRAEQAILEIGEDADPRGFVGLGEAVREAVFEIEESPNRNYTGLPTGFEDWDRITQGLNPGNLIIIAGRPGMGKTSFALNVARNVCMKGKASVALFSLEMSTQELAMRMLSSETRIGLKRLRTATISDREWQRVHQAARDMSEAKLYIDDGANPSLLEITSKARRLKMDRGLDLLILDYLQLMQAGGRYENRNLEIAAITRGLKQLSKEVGIPVIALSQLSRQTERRGSDHRPQLADLRESGAIEQDADQVAFIYRDEVYNPDEEENRGLAELIVAKNRHGETDRIALAFLGEFTLFQNLARGDVG